MNIIQRTLNGLSLSSPGIKKNLLTSLYYFGGSFVGMVIAIFTQPIFSRNLEPRDFAVMGYFAAIQGFFMPMFSLNFTSYYLTSYWDKSATKGKDISFHLNTLNIANALVAFLAFLLVVTYFKLARVSFPLHPFTLLIIINLLIEKYKAYYLLHCRLNKLGPNYFLFSVSQVILNTGFGLLFVVYFKWGAEGRMLGQTLSVILLVIFIAGVFIKKGFYHPSFKIDISAVKQALKFCWPLIIGSYFYFPVSNLDKLLLERIGNVQEFGYFNLGSSLAGYLATFFITLYMAFEPDFYKLTTQRRIREYFSLSLAYIAVLTMVTVTAILFSEPIIGFLTSYRYPEAAKYFNIIVVSMCLYNIGDMFQQLFNSLNNTRLVLIRNAIMGAISIVLYYFFIKKFGFIGAAWAKVAIYSFYIIIGLILFITHYSHQIGVVIKKK